MDLKFLRTNVFLRDKVEKGGRLLEKRKGRRMKHYKPKLNKGRKIFDTLSFIKKYNFVS